MNDFSIHWSESLTWAKCSVAQGFKGNPHSPVLHSTLWRPLSNCCASPVHKQRLQHRQNCCLLCVHTGVWRGWDNTFLKIISVGGTQSLFSGDFCNHECISQQTQNPGVKRCPSHVAAAGWCEHGISPWTGFAGVRQLSPEPEQVYMGPAMCIASRNSWSSPPICWLLRGHAPWWRFLGTAKLMWLSWKSHSKLSLPPKVRRGEGFNPPKCLLSHGSAHIWCAPLMIGQQYGRSESCGISPHHKKLLIALGLPQKPQPDL